MKISFFSVTIYLFALAIGAQDFGIQQEGALDYYEDGGTCGEILEECFGEESDCNGSIDCQAKCMRDYGCDASVEEGPPRVLKIPRIQPNDYCPTREWYECWFGLSWCEKKDSGSPLGPRYPVCHEEGTPTSMDEMEEFYFYGSNQ